MGGFVWTVFCVPLGMFLVGGAKLCTIGLVASGNSGV